MYSLRVSLGVFVITGVAVAQQYMISTVAGGAPPPTPLPAVNASVGAPFGVATDSSGNMYFTSQYCVFKVSSNGVLTRVAGSSRRGYSGDGGPATGAQLFSPSGLALDSTGNLYIADGGDHRVRKVSTDGIITTIAGTGTAGFSGDSGPAASAQLNVPAGVAVDAAGAVYIADTLNYRVRKISPDGIIITVAGNGVKGYSGDGGSAKAAQLQMPTDVAVDSVGTLYIADLGNQRVRKVAVTGIITTALGSNDIVFYEGIGLDTVGNLYAADFYNNVVVRVSPDGVVTTIAGDSGRFGFSGDGGLATNAILNNPSDVAVDASGTLYIADTMNHRVRRVSNAGIIMTVAGNGILSYSGDGGPATDAQMDYLFGLAVDAAGILYIADTDNQRVRMVSRTGIITTVAGDGIRGYIGDRGPATRARLYSPFGVAVDNGGALYIADYGNDRIRKVSPSGIITTVAATSMPQAVAVDSAGNLYIAEDGTQHVRKVSSEGTITTVPGINSGSGITVDTAGNLYVAQGLRVLKVSRDGVITTVAGNGTAGYSGDGGPATSAQFSDALGVAADRAGNLYITDSGNFVVRKISTSGIITTIAGDGNQGYSGDGGPATKARLTYPYAVTVDDAGGVYVSMWGAVRLLQPISTPLSITTASPLPTGAVGTSYSTALAATGGVPPYTWSLVAGTLPGDLILSSAGAITGMPTAVGTATFTVQVRDNASATATQSFQLTITSASPLCTYAISPGGQAFSAPGGTGSITVTTGGGCGWTAAAPPSWIAWTSATTGSGNGLLTYQVSANDGAARCGNAVIAGRSFAIEQSAAAIPGIAAAGSIGHIASQGTWKFTLDLVNLGSAPADARINFLSDSGEALQLPLMFPQAPRDVEPLLASTLDRSLGANELLTIESAGLDEAGMLTGWAQLHANGAVTGFGIFSNALYHWGAVVPLETRNGESYWLVFDNTGAIATGVAIASVSTQPANVSVVIRDENGVGIGAGTIPLTAQGHTSFMLDQQYPVTAGKRGTIQFLTPPSGQISLLGLRANGAALTSLPVLADVRTGGGSITHSTFNSGFSSTFYLVNTGTSTGSFTLSFLDDDGNPQQVPLLLPQSGAALTASQVTRTLDPGAVLVVETQAQDSLQRVQGSAMVTSNGTVGGFEIFRWTAYGQEASVPLETRTPGSFVLVFDNTGGWTTGVALAKVDATAATVTLNLRDDKGTLLEANSIQLPSRGHTSFMLPDTYPVSGGRRGTAEFVVPGNGSITVIGLRAGSDGTLTTIPVLTAAARTDQP